MNCKNTAIKLAYVQKVKGRDCIKQNDSAWPLKSLLEQASENSETNPSVQSLEEKVSHSVSTSFPFIERKAFLPLHSTALCPGGSGPRAESEPETSLCVAVPSQSLMRWALRRCLPGREKEGMMAFC